MNWPPLRFIPELRDLRPADRRRMWESALHAPLQWTDILWLMLAFAPLAPMIWLDVLYGKPVIHPWLSRLIHAGIFVLLYSWMSIVMMFRSRPLIRKLRAISPPPWRHAPSSFF